MSQDLLERRQRIFGRGAHLFYRKPLTIVRGEGVYLFAQDGTSYVDMYNNVPCIGHSHPHLVEAIHEQVSKINVHNRYLHDGILRYAERLVDTHHQGIESVVMSCTGTEANEVAMLMARSVTQGKGFICTDAAYHGNSAAVRQLTRARDTKFVKAIPFPESYRCQATDRAQHFLHHIDQKLADFEQDGIQVAGLLICSLCANEGLPNIPSGFMREAADRIRAAGGVVIADEVQAGLGRSGNWWGYTSSDFVPDIVTMGKPLGAGVPLAATASSQDFVERFRRHTGYFNTFASSPLQAAAGNAVLDIFEREQLIQNAAVIGSYLAEQLQSINQLVPYIGDTRHQGLFVAVECVKSRDTKEPDRHRAIEIVNALKDRGFLTGNAGAFGNVLKLRPPLVFTRTHADAFLAEYMKVVDAE